MSRNDRRYHPPSSYLENDLLLHEDISDISLDDLTSDELDEVLRELPDDDSRPPDAYALAPNDLLRELVDRGIQPKGFFNDDAANLQVEYNKEHLLARDKRRETILENAVKKHKYKKYLRQKQQNEAELNEEKIEIMKDQKIQVWMDLIKRDKTPEQACIRVNSISVRAIAKQLCTNTSLRVLDLARNGLDDKAGKSIATLLHWNRSLVKLELENNSFGPLTAKEIAVALQVNNTLTFLSMNSNPLTLEETDYSGISAIGDMLAVNQALKSLNLWETHLGSDGGKILAQAIKKNNTLVYLDYGNNEIGQHEAKLLSWKLEENKMLLEKIQRRKYEIKKQFIISAETERKKKEEIRKMEETNKWIEDQRLIRLKEREKSEIERKERIEAEETRMREVSRLQYERFLLDEAAKKKGKKKKKVKGKGKGKSVK